MCQPPQFVQLSPSQCITHFVGASSEGVCPTFSFSDMVEVFVVFEEW